MGKSGSRFKVSTSARSTVSEQASALLRAVSGRRATRCSCRRHAVLLDVNELVMLRYKLINILHVIQYHRGLIEHRYCQLLDAQEFDWNLITLGRLFSSFFFFNNPPPPEISPLPLPTALPILTAIGVSQVLQIVAALSGSAASFQDGRIDFGLAAWVALFELAGVAAGVRLAHAVSSTVLRRSEEHTSELQSPCNLVCRLLLEKK